MNRHYNELDDDELEAEFRELGFQDGKSSESDGADEDSKSDAEDVDDDDAPPPEYSTGERGVEISRYGTRKTHRCRGVRRWAIASRRPSREWRTDAGCTAR